MEVKLKAKVTTQIKQQYFNTGLITVMMDTAVRGCSSKWGIRQVMHAKIHA